VYERWQLDDTDGPPALVEADACAALPGRTPAAPAAALVIPALFGEPLRALPPADQDRHARSSEQPRPSSSRGPAPREATVTPLFVGRLKLEPPPPPADGEPGGEGPRDGDDEDVPF
jgi:hypothetical protein